MRRADSREGFVRLWNQMAAAGHGRGEVAACFSSCRACSSPSPQSPAPRPPQCSPPSGLCCGDPTRPHCDRSLIVSDGGWRGRKPWTPHAVTRVPPVRPLPGPGSALSPAGPDTGGPEPGCASRFSLESVSGCVPRTRVLWRVTTPLPPSMCPHPLGLQHRDSRWTPPGAFPFGEMLGPGPLM